MVVRDFTYTLCSFDGMLRLTSVDECQLFYNLARKCKAGSIVELGSLTGFSTAHFALGSLHGSGVTVYAVDPFEGQLGNGEDKGNTYDRFMKNMKEAGVDSVIHPMVMTSEQAASVFDKPVELLFIDALHDSFHVQQDFELWFPKIIEGGHILFHDCDIHEVDTFVRANILHHQHIRDIKQVDTTVYGVKSTGFTWVNNI